MEYEKIKQLIDDMGNSNLSSINIDFPDGTKISMTKEDSKKVIVENKENVKNVLEEKAIMPEVKNEDVKIVKSPMVGTFYSKPSPTASSYAQVGKEVKVGDTLCIIEAMKLMNEIESEFAGKISKVLVKDGDVVEYGMPLFEIE